VVAVNSPWWGEQQPSVVPRHILALYVGGAHHAGLAPEQFMTFIGARNFVSTVTVGLKEDKVALEKGDEVLKLWLLGAVPKDALRQVFRPDEVKPEQLPFS
jgi:hypothetical protein